MLHFVRKNASAMNSAVISAVNCFLKAIIDIPTGHHNTDHALKLDFFKFSIIIFSANT